VRRRDFLLAVGGAATYPRPTWAQPHRLPTIGYLAEGSPLAIQVSEFRKGLADMGYVEGRNVAIEFRAAHNDLTRLRELARDLVRLEVDVIVAPGSGAAARAARAATGTIPIVFSNSGDPVTSGLIASLGHPGGNVTGISDFGDGMSAKRMEFMKLLVPAVSSVALLIRANNSVAARYAAAAREPARSLGSKHSPSQLATLPRSTPPSQRSRTSVRTDFASFPTFCSSTAASASSILRHATASRAPIRRSGSCNTAGS
jgi:putative tryptophan/tyrosine transport system substrate-binding protein